jgi:hypothetical protein
VQYSFVKSAESKAEWLQDQLLMQQQRDDYKELKFFPKRGASCYAYMRRCEFYGSCEVSFDNAFGKEYSELANCIGFDDIAVAEPIDYAVTLSDLIDTQKRNMI